MNVKVSRNIFGVLISGAYLALALLVLLVAPSLLAQNGDVPLNLRSNIANRRAGIHNGNLVKTKFQNDGLGGSKNFILPGQPTFAWPVERNEYIYDLNVLVGVEKIFQDTIVYNTGSTSVGTRLRDNRSNTQVLRNSQTVLLNANFIVPTGAFQNRPAAIVVDTARYATTHQGPRGGGYRVINGQFEGLQPVGGFSNSLEEFPAMSHLPNTWPAAWPDQPTWLRDGRAEWNGYFGRGITNADQESYTVVDDATDRRLFEEFGFLPIPTDPARFGAGLQLKIRGLQWANFLAQDNIFWIYDIKNISTTDYDKAVFGSVVGTAVGGEAQFARNLSVFDQKINVTYTWNPISPPSNLRPDPNAVSADWNRNFPAGFAGVAFLESPGNPFDGVDNDDDWNLIANGPFSVPNRGTLGLGQFSQIQNNDSTRASETGYEFFQSASSIPALGLFIGGNSYRLVRPGSVLITVTQRDTLTVDMISAGYNRPVIYYERRAVVVPTNAPNNFSVTLTSLGRTRTLRLNDTLREQAGNLVDDNYNGVIDEDFRLHFRRTRLDNNIITGQSQYVQLPALHFVDYIALARANENLNDFRRFPMIDERRDDGLDNNGNWQLIDDVGADGVAGTGDIGERDGRPTNGEPNFDRTDPQESDQIGLSSFFFALSSFPQMGSSASLWDAVRPGRLDTTGFIARDGDYTYGTGYFPLKRNQTERFSIAVAYGLDAQSILENVSVVQEIYNSNYNFSSPPKPEPRVTAIAGDRTVQLYWTNESEEFFDSFINRKITGGIGTSPLAKTFEGYKIYKASDPGFLDARVITGANGEPGQRLRPVAQFDKIDGVRDFFPLVGNLARQARGVSFFLGSETGLTNTWVDNDVQNGRTYYYGVAAYSKGYINPTNAEASILPSENSVGATIDSRGRVILPPNVVVVQPRAREAGFVDIQATDTLGISPTNRGDGKMYLSVVNARKITSDKTLRVEFTDTGNDGIDNDTNGVVDDLLERLQPKTSSFRVLDITNPARPDTLLRRSGVIAGQFVRPLNNPSIYIETPTSDRLFPASGETSVIDRTGIFFTIQNNGIVTQADTLRSTWKTVTPVASNVVPQLTVIPSIDSGGVIPFYGLDVRARGIRGIPDDYAIIIRPIGSVQSDSVRLRFVNPLFPSEVPPVQTNFIVYNLTKQRRERFAVDPSGSQVVIGQGAFDNIDINLFPVPTPPGGFDTLISWKLRVTPRAGYISRVGDSLFVRFKKPILQGDNFIATLTPPRVETERIKDALANIKVFPNPYLITNTAEGNVPLGVRGRAERRLFFKNVPLNATIRIYTIRGELIRTLRADTPDGTGSNGVVFGEKDRGENGTINYTSSQVQWDLKTFENLDIAFGVYLYHVDAPGIGTKTGKFAVIK
jgi:hypothetical protein